MSSPATDVLISEVGPRDGLQSVKATMATAHKLAWSSALHAAGLREIEVASFVPAHRLPQMADAAAVVRHALTLPGLTVMALVPNLRGAEAALAAGVHKLTVPVSASAAHSLANVRKTREAMVAEVRHIVALLRAAAITPQVGNDQAGVRRQPLRHPVPQRTGLRKSVQQQQRRCTAAAAGAGVHAHAANIEVAGFETLKPVCVRAHGPA